MDPEQSEPGLTFDAAGLLASLARSRIEQEAVAERRPSAQTLSDTLSKATDLLYQWTHHSRRLAALQAGEDPEKTYRWFPHAGSLAASDRDDLEPKVTAFVQSCSPTATHWLSTNPRRNPAAWGIDYLRRCFQTVIDDLSAISVLIATDSHLRAPITLSRSAMEAAAVACFIVDASVDDSERCRRILNLHFEELKESANAGRDRQGDNEDEVEIQELISFAEHLHFNPKRYKPEGWQPPILLAEGRRRPDSARMIVNQVLPGGLGLAMWRSMSAVAHAREAQTLLPDEYSLPHEIKAWKRAETVAWHTVPTLLVVRQLCARLETYLGWDFAEWSGLFDVVTNQWGIGAGLQDKLIRRELGLD